MRKTKYHFCGILARNLKETVNHEKTSDKHKLRASLQNKVPVLFKQFKITRGKERLQNYCILEKTKTIWQVSTMCGPRLDLKWGGKCTPIHTSIEDIREATKI